MSDPSQINMMASEPGQSGQGSGSGSEGSPRVKRKAAGPKLAKGSSKAKAKGAHVISFEDANDRAELLKVIADRPRIMILYHLSSPVSPAVAELARLVEQTQPAVSHHLMKLRMMRIVRSIKDGKQTRYHLTELGQSLFEFVRDLHVRRN